MKKLLLLVWCICGSAAHAMVVPPGYQFKEEKLIPGYGKKIIFENEKGLVVVKLVADTAPSTQPPIGGVANAATKPSFPPPPQQKNIQQPSPSQIAALPALRQQVPSSATQTITPPKQQIAKVESRTLKQAPPSSMSDIEKHIHMHFADVSPREIHVGEREAYLMALNTYHESAGLRGPNEV